jgi:hypothetical protein
MLHYWDSDEQRTELMFKAFMARISFIIVSIILVMAGDGVVLVDINAFNQNGLSVHQHLAVFEFHFSEAHF